MVAQHSECTKCHWIVHFKLTLCYAHFTTIFKNKQKRCTDKHGNPGNVWNEVQRLWAKLTWDLCRSSLVTQKVKNLSAKQETWTWFLGWEDPLEKGMVTHSRIPAWRIPWTEEPGGLQSMGLQRIEHDSVTNTSAGEVEGGWEVRRAFHFIPFSVLLFKSSPFVTGGFWLLFFLIITQLRNKCITLI